VPVQSSWVYKYQFVYEAENEAVTWLLVENEVVSVAESNDPKVPEARKLEANVAHGMVLVQWAYPKECQIVTSRLYFAGPRIYPDPYGKVMLIIENDH